MSGSSILTVLSDAPPSPACTIPVGEVTPSVSRRAGQLLGNRLAETDGGDGHGLGKDDAVIAATALNRDEFVLATDSHFATIPSVSVETYR